MSVGRRASPASQVREHVAYTEFGNEVGVLVRPEGAA